MVARGSRPRGRAGRVVGLTLLAVLTTLAVSGCSADKWLGLGWPVDGISDRSKRMYDLWIGSVIAALVVGAFVWGLIFWCIIRYRKRGDALPPQTRYNLPIELLYTIVPFLIISVLFYYTAIVETAVDQQPTAEPQVTVDITAFKWNWEFAYRGKAGPDGKPVTTIGTSDYIAVLVVPVNETIRFTEHSQDVIHSFWVPELLFKRDVFPGNVVNSFVVTINKPGPYVGRCAELCGTYHSQMNFELRAVSEDEYAQFIAAKQKGLSTPDALRAAGDPEPYATTTHPFNTDRTSRTAS